MSDAEFVREVDENQLRLRGSLRATYDFIVCGSGSSGAVVARRLAENLDVSVLLIEAGGCDHVPEVEMAAAWPHNLGSARDWGFTALPIPHLNGRAMPMNMGKVLGGGSSINVMLWARGHRSDWDYFAAEAAIPLGATSPFWASTARSKTGKACPIPPDADAMVCSTSRLRSSRTPSLPRCSTQQPNLASLSSTT